jgi:hypothetical protein
MLLAPVAVVLWLLDGAAAVAAAASASAAGPEFPPSLEQYADSHLTSLWEVLRHRVEQEPLNFWVTLLFAAAVLHTFLSQRFLQWSHRVEERHQARVRADSGAAAPVCIQARLLHFLGEVEIVFAIWVVPLVLLLTWKVGWASAADYLSHRVRFVEPLFVVAIMAVSSTRPVLQLAERCLRFFARLGGGGPGAWWLTILTLGPLLGSLITEPAAMTISALLLARQFYELKPPPRLAYATMGLLFVNVSVGGVLTHFAAPPVLIVAATWQWSAAYMLQHFGWIAVMGILIANAGYYLVFRRELARLVPAAGAASARGDSGKPPVPGWVTAVHVLFIGWIVWTAHHPVLFLGGSLFFLAFHEVTEDYQSELQLRSPVLVGCFLAGLVIHGGLQQWWIEPVLGRLSEVPLMLGAIGLTAFNDNAAITYLSTLVPGLTEGLKHAVVAGAVTGGGLTVIANAPNPAGQSRGFRRWDCFWRRCRRRLCWRCVFCCCSRRLERDSPGQQTIHAFLSADQRRSAGRTRADQSSSIDSPA